MAIALTNLALVLRDIGDLAGARAQRERALEILDAAYGPDHARSKAVRVALGAI